MSGVDRYLRGREAQTDVRVRKAVDERLAELGVIDVEREQIDPTGCRVLTFDEVYGADEPT